LPQLICLLCGNFVDLKGIQHIEDVQNVLSIFQGASKKKQTILVLTETCGLHAIIVVTTCTQRWYEKHLPEASMRP